MCIIFPPSDPSPQLGPEIRSGSILKVLKAVCSSGSKCIFVRSLPRAAAEGVFRVLHGRENVPACLVGKFGVSLEYTECKGSISALLYSVFGEDNDLGHIYTAQEWGTEIHDLPCPVETDTGSVSEIVNLVINTPIGIVSISPQSSIWLPLASCAGVTAV